MQVPSLLRNRPLWTVMSGHFAVDHFSGLMPALYPLLVLTLHLSVFEVGLIAAAYQNTLSLSQPFFGYLADRIGTRWTSGLAVLWMAVAFASLGWINDYWLLVGVAAAAGLGSGAYHPQGAMNAALVIDNRDRNTAMALYTLGGTGGYAIGPIIGAAVMGVFGKGATTFLAIPAACIALWLLVEMRVVTRRTSARPGGAAAVTPRRQGDMAALTRIVLALMIRSAGYFAVTTFLTIWFQQLGHGPEYYSVILSTLLIAAVVGTFIGGLLADRLGRRRVMLISLFSLGPLMFLFVQAVQAGSHPLIVAGLAFLTGLIADAPFPLALVTAQQLMPGKMGVASGLILGFTFSAGSVGAIVFGLLANQIGLGGALTLATALPLIAALLFLTIPIDIMARPSASASASPVVATATADDSTR